MKAIKAIAISLLVAATTLSAQAQFKWGPRVGMNVSLLSFDKSTFNSENRAGFTAGLQCEFTVPLIGVGADASVMYVRRTAEFMNKVTDAKKVSNRDYITIPVNLKYKLNLPAVNHIVRPFVTTGPEFSFLTSRTAISNAYYNKEFDWSWNLGLGIELFKHLQVAASYGWGISDSWAVKSSVAHAERIDGKNRYWTITASYLF